MVQQIQGSGRAASTGVILARWTALGERQSLTSALHVDWSAAGSRIWLNFVGRVFADEDALTCIRDAGTRATAQDEYLQNSNAIISQRLASSDPSLRAHLLPSLRVLRSPSSTESMLPESKALMG